LRQLIVPWWQGQQPYSDNRTHQPYPTLAKHLAEGIWQ
ncbi:hypothetical protein BAE44_0010064, partial [Dichanthelium oligosanthes]